MNLLPYQKITTSLASALIIAGLAGVPCSADDRDDNNHGGGMGGGIGFTFDFSHANSSNNSSTKAKKKKSSDDDTPAPKKAVPKPAPEKEPPVMAMPQTSDDADNCAQLLAKVRAAQEELYKADQRYQAASAAEADASAKYIQAANDFLDTVKKMQDAKAAVKKATGKDYDPAAKKWDDSVDATAKARIKMEKAGDVWNDASEDLRKALDNVHAAGTVFKAWRAEYEKHCGPYDSRGYWDKLHGKTVPPDDTWHDDW